MVTLRENVAAYDRIKLKRAAEVDATKFEGLCTEILGQQIKTPICIVSTAFQRMAHPEGEIATAGAAEKTGTPQVLSGWANSTIEDVAKTAPTGLKMMQVYLSKSPEVNKDIWKRAKDAGFKALCLTTDTQLLGKRERDARLKFSLPKHLDCKILAKYSK